MIKFFRKYHKWLGVILTIFIVLFSISGIILNHRELVSSIDVSRDYLPSEYEYQYWNNASVKGSEEINQDSILVYGNVGIWLTDSTYTNYSDFNQGFKRGVDNKKISSLLKTKSNDLYAGTLFGLFKYEYPRKQWKKIKLPLHKQRIVDITEKGDSLLVLTRSNLLVSTNHKDFEVLNLPEPVGYDNKVGLFKTLWVIHSGEIYGEVGKIIVDIIGLIFIFLTVSGLIFFVNRYLIKKHKANKTLSSKLKSSSKWNLKWHNKIGWTTVVLLVLTTTTGMFLRPPLLIAIGNTKVGKIPFTELANSNPWFDQLRGIKYHRETKAFIISTSEGMFHANENLDFPLQRFQIEPPVSVMGINVFEQISPQTFIVGSFSGVFMWQPYSGRILDVISGSPYSAPFGFSSPIGKDMISGYIKNYRGHEVFLDYNRGAISRQMFPNMPENLSSQPMSLWNLALEVHTARIYNCIIGFFYILIIPLFGLMILFILISGFVVWYKRYNNKRKTKSKKQSKKVVSPTNIMDKV